MTNPELTYLATKSKLKWHKALLSLYLSHFMSLAETMFDYKVMLQSGKEAFILYGICIICLLKPKHSEFKKTVSDIITALHLLSGGNEEVRHQGNTPLKEEAH